MEWIIEAGRSRPGGVGLKVRRQKLIADGLKRRIIVRSQSDSGMDGREGILCSFILDF